MNETSWRKSTYSGGANGECVEVALVETVGVRDTKDRKGGELTVDAQSWSAFVGKVKAQH